LAFTEPNTDKFFNTASVAQAAAGAVAASVSNKSGGVCFSGSCLCLIESSVGPGPRLPVADFVPR
jgi:hypothetical protein